MGKRSHVWAGPHEHVVVHRPHGGGGGSSGSDDSSKVVLIIVGLIFLGFLVYYFRNVFEWIIALCIIGLFIGGKHKK